MEEGGHSECQCSMPENFSSHMHLLDYEVFSMWQQYFFPTGNTCFMNSVIQCLSNTAPLRQYFVSGSFKKDVNREYNKKTRGRLAEVSAVAASGGCSRLSAVKTSVSIFLRQFVLGAFSSFFFALCAYLFVS